jgi:O-antigen/teichoic acid export membrane protein
MEKSKPLTLRRNFSWTFIGNTVYAACQWGMVMMLAKLGSPEMVGQFTLGFAITAPVFMFSNLQLRVIQATDAKQQYQFADYLGLRLIATTIGLLVVAGITLMSGYRPQTALVVMLVALAKAFESISDVFYGLIQQHERMDRIALSLMIKGPLSLLLLGFGVYLTNNVVWGVAGLTVAWAGILLFHDLRNGAALLKDAAANENYNLKAKKHVLQPRWDVKTLVKLIKYAAPLGFVMMLISLNSNIPRYFIERHLGERELGVFAAMAYLMVLGSMVINALGESASPRLAKYFANNNASAFRLLLLKLVGIAGVIGSISVVISLVGGKQILTLLYSAEYAKHTTLFVWLMIAAGMGYVSSFLGYGMTTAQYFRIQIPLFSAVTGASALASMWLIPAYGLQGAAIALIVSSVVQVIISWGIITHALKKLSSLQET